MRFAKAGSRVGGIEPSKQLVASVRKQCVELVQQELSGGFGIVLENLTVKPKGFIFQTAVPTVVDFFECCEERFPVNPSFAEERKYEFAQFGNADPVFYVYMCDTVFEFVNHPFHVFQAVEDVVRGIEIDAVRRMRHFFQ